MGKPGFPNCGEPVEPHPCLWRRQALPTGRVWEGEALPETIKFILAWCGTAAQAPVAQITTKGTSRMIATCPECGAEVTLPEDTMESEIIVCPECGAELEVVSLNPPTLALAPEVEEDWGE